MFWMWFSSADVTHIVVALVWEKLGVCNKQYRRRGGKQPVLPTWKMGIYENDILNVVISQYENSVIFLPLRFYVKTMSENLKHQKPFFLNNDFDSFEFLANLCNFWMLKWNLHFYAKIGGGLYFILSVRKSLKFSHPICLVGNTVKENNS